MGVSLGIRGSEPQHQSAQAPSCMDLASGEMKDKEALLETLDSALVHQGRTLREFKGHSQMCIYGVLIMAQRKRIRLGTVRLRVRSLASLSGLRIQCCRSCGVGHRCGSDPELLWLWRRLAATAPTGPLAWEPPYAAGAALEKTK